MPNSMQIMILPPCLIYVAQWHAKLMGIWRWEVKMAKQVVTYLKQLRSVYRLLSPKEKHEDYIVLIVF